MAQEAVLIKEITADEPTRDLIKNIMLNKHLLKPTSIKDELANSHKIHISRQACNIHIKEILYDMLINYNSPAANTKIELAKTDLSNRAKYSLKRMQFWADFDYPFSLKQFKDVIGADRIIRLYILRYLNERISFEAHGYQASRGKMVAEDMIEDTIEYFIAKTGWQSLDKIERFYGMPFYKDHWLKEGDELYEKPLTEDELHKELLEGGHYEKHRKDIGEVKPIPKELNEFNTPSWMKYFLRELHDKQTELNHRPKFIKREPFKTPIAKDALRLLDEAVEYLNNVYIFDEGCEIKQESFNLKDIAINHLGGVVD